MKAIFLTMFLFFVAQVSHAVVQFEVQPRTIQAKSEVVGVQAPNGQQAIIVTGQTAERLAHECGYYNFDPLTQMIVMTGAEVSRLVGSAVYTGVAAGGLILITTAAFTSAALQLAFGVISIAGQFVWIGISTALTIAKSIISLILGGLGGFGSPCYVIDDYGPRRHCEGVRRLPKIIEDEDDCYYPGSKVGGLAPASCH